jgi:glutamyl-tRNA reductase
MAYYYGIPWYEVDDMPATLVAGYMNCLEIIHSQEALVDLEVTSFPYLQDKSKRKQLVKKYEDNAFKLKPKNIQSFDALELKLGKLYHGG